MGGGGDFAFFFSISRSKICRGKNLIQFITLTNEINKTGVWETVHFCTSPTFDVFTFACRPEKENRGTTGLGLGLGVT